jgi:hypothetical protein
LAIFHWIQKHKRCKNSYTFIYQIIVIFISNDSLKTMDYSRLCKGIFDLDQKIRFAAICNRTGEIKYGGQCEGVRSYLSLEQTKESVQQAWNRWKLRDAMESTIGKGKFAMA